MSLSPKICFVCRMPTYNLDGHLATCHTRCDGCQYWNRCCPNSSAHKQCRRCSADLCVAPAAPAATQSTTTAGPKGYVTRKCTFHRGQKTSYSEIRNCALCRIHPISPPHHR